MTNPFDLIDQRLSNIENLLIDLKHPATPPPPQDQDKWMDLPELCEYLPDKPQRATVYSWVSNSLIPCHKGGKKLRFLKSDIDNWMKSGRRKTFAELQAETSKRAKR